MYKIKRFFENLYYCLRARRFKQLSWLIRFWFNYIPCDYCFGLKLFKWDIDNLIQTFEENPNYHVGQDRVLKDLKVFSECLDRLIQDDFYTENPFTGEFSKKLTNAKVKEMEELSCKLFKKVRHWWI